MHVIFLHNSKSLGAFAKFLKAATGFIVSVRLCIRLEQLDYHWTDFH